VPVAIERTALDIPRVRQWRQRGLQIEIDPNDAAIAQALSRNALMV